MNRAKHVVLLSVIFLLPMLLFGQNIHELLIPKPTTGSDFLNDKILGDTLATGARKDLDRIYVLERGTQSQPSIYFLRSVLRNDKPKPWVLRIKAQEGTGTRPIIYFIRNTVTNTTPGYFAQLYGNLWIKDLIISGLFEPDTTSATFGTMPGNNTDVNAAGQDIIIDNCILTEASGQLIRTGAAARVIKVTNTVFANMGFLGTSNLGAGKGVDLRAGSCDTLLLVNNTFVNAQDRIVRHYLSTLALKYMLFDHNTIVNCMSYHGMLSLGKVGKKMVITNNLLLDPFALGNDTDKTRQGEFKDSKENDPYGGARMTWVISEPNDTTQWVVKNNVYSISTAGQSFYDKYKSVGVTGEGSPLTWHINKKLGADSVNAFKKASVALTNVPKLMTAMMDWYRSPTGGKKSKNTPTAAWIRKYHDYDRRLVKYFSDTLKCDYSTSLAAYTGADEGFPVGDLNWFPDKKSQWQQQTAVRTNEGMPNTMVLNQNYPNPFNPSTKISFVLEKAGYATLTVYNTLGQKVATPVSGKLSSGQHEIHFNASGLASGVYVYQLESADRTVMKKMLLMR